MQANAASTRAASAGPGNREEIEQVLADYWDDKLVQKKAVVFGR